MILKISLLWILCLLSFQKAEAQGNSAQLMFDKANEELKENKPESAINLYRQIVNQGYQSPELYLNLGYTAIQLDSLGLALAYFKKAEAFQQVREDALNGIEYIEARLPNRAAQLPMLPWDKAVQWLETNFGSNVITQTSLIILYSSLLGWLLFWFKFSERYLLRQISLMLFVLSLGTLSLAGYVKSVEVRFDKAVMIVKEDAVYSQPDNDSELVSKAYEGYQFIIDHSTPSEVSNWYYVRMSNGLYGWINSNTVIIL